MTFGLSLNDWNTLKSILIDPLKNEDSKVWIFGSRATGRFRKFSDIDVLFETSKPLPVAFLSQIKEKLEESNLPIKVDIVETIHLAESYAEQILKDRIAV